MPWGRKMSTRTSIVNAIDVLELVGRRHTEAVEEQRGTDRLELTQEDAADHGAGDVADAAQDGRREGLDAGDEAE